MKAFSLFCSAALFLVGPQSSSGQAFVNFAFEDGVILDPSAPFLYSTVPGWEWNTGFGLVPLNQVALSGAGVTLQGVNSPYAPAIAGNYSLTLQGGISLLSEGAFIAQTGQIPAGTRSLLYAGGPMLQVSFAGQPLTPVVLGTFPSYNLWGVDVSAFAGQVGQLRFTQLHFGTSNTPSYLDNISFSTSPVPEPATWVFCAAAALGWVALRRRKTTST